MALFHRLGPEGRRLRQFPTFSSLTDAELERLVQASAKATLPARWGMIHEQTPGDACYILLEGTVAVYSGKEQVAQLGPGEVIGEVALRKNTLRSATVSTLDPVELLRIERADLDRLLTEIPALVEAIDATIARHLGRHTDERA